MAWLKEVYTKKLEPGVRVGFVAPPAFETPPGVILRPLAENERNNTPVLVCKSCGHPTLHLRAAIVHGALATCGTCGTERRW